MVCSGKWDGEFDSHKQHITCYDFARRLNRVGEPGFYECEVPFGAVTETVNEMFDDCPTVSGIKAEWQQIVESHPPFEVHP